jgi:gliding-associated putative ABC transporter substrate-binding component GldG
LPEGVNKEEFKHEGVSTKLIVIADGDMARNDINPRTNQPQQLGYDPFTQYTFANRDLLMNALAYLTNENGLIAARNKEVKIRPLDKDRTHGEKLKWQIINLVLPVILLCLFGVLKFVIRKRKFASF